MFANRLFAAAVLAAVAWFAASAAADDAKTDESKTKISDKDIEGWIKQLDSADFTEREIASTKLRKAGKPAIDALQGAAESSSLEVSKRALHVLQNFHQSEDVATRDAANKALEKLAAGENGRVARTARSILDAEDKAQRDARQREQQNAQNNIQNQIQQQIGQIIIQAFQQAAEGIPNGDQPTKDDIKALEELESEINKTLEEVKKLAAKDTAALSKIQEKIEAACKRAEKIQERFEK